MTGKPFAFSIQFPHGRDVGSNRLRCGRCGADTDLEVGWNSASDPAVTVSCAAGHLSTTNVLTAEMAQNTYDHYANR